MTELLPNIFAIEVPEDSKDHGLTHIYAGEDILYWYDKRGNRDRMWVDINAYQAEILFTTKDAVAFDAEKVCSWFELAGQKGWQNYESEYVSYPFHSAYHSLQSLLKSKGLTAGNYLIVKMVG